MQVDQCLGVQGAQPLEHFVGEPPFGSHEGRAEAAVQIAVPGQVAVGELRQRKRRLHRAHEGHQIHGRTYTGAQPRVQGAHPGGLVPMEQGHEHPGPPAVPTGNHEPARAREPLEELLGRLPERGHRRRLPYPEITRFRHALAPEVYTSACAV